MPEVAQAKVQDAGNSDTRLCAGLLVIGACALAGVGFVAFQAWMEGMLVFINEDTGGSRAIVDCLSSSHSAHEVSAVLAISQP